jgi:hypothetical protein
MTHRGAQSDPPESAGSYYKYDGEHWDSLADYLIERERNLLAKM